jgi:hypothetical protein
MADSTPTADRTGPEGGSGDGDVPRDADSGSDPDPDHLRDWTLATLHATVFTLVPLLALLLSGGLGDLLGGLDTAVGLALFAYLWLVLLLTTRRALAAVDLAARRSALRAGLVWGAAAGVGFVGVVLLVAGTAVAATSGNLLFLPIAAGVGSLVAAVVGALLGVLFAAIDLGLLAVAARLADATAGA